MKTKNFILCAIILMMISVMGATAQSARRGRDVHNNNSRNEVKSATRNEVRGNQNIRYNGNSRQETRFDHSDQPRTSQNSQRTENTQEIQMETKNPQRTINQNYNRPNTNERQVNRSNDKGNYDRGRYDRQKDYNQENFRNRQFSNYYRKNHFPYNFRDNHNYWYNPHYGHILKGFRHNPIIIYSDRVPFYFDNGFLYRYYNGIGFVWIEDPYDLWFNELPYQTIKIMINGRIYFKLGNAYFEFGNRGFHLAILPDYYYSNSY